MSETSKLHRSGDPDFYSNHPKPSNVKVAFSSIPLKGASEKATHMIGITSESSQSLADFRNSLKGDDWDLYISKMNNYVKSNSASAGRDLITNGSETSYPIGQAWIFKVKNMQLSTMVQDVWSVRHHHGGFGRDFLRLPDHTRLPPRSCTRPRRRLGLVDQTVGWDV